MNVELIELFRSEQGGLIEVTSYGEDKVVYHQQGGGFRGETNREDFDKKFTRVTEPLPWVKMRVELSVWGFGPFEAYSNGLMRNGYLMPRFTDEQMKDIMKSFPGVKYDHMKATYVAGPMKGRPDDEPEVYKLEAINADGVDLVVYVFGEEWEWSETCPDEGGEATLP